MTSPAHPEETSAYAPSATTHTTVKRAAAPEREAYVHPARLDQPALREWDFTDAAGDAVVVLGRMLGRASSVKDGHNHPEEYAEKGVRCSACRWFDVSILAVDEDDEAGADYVVYTCGRTIVPGEVDRPRFVWTSSPREVVESLVVRQDGQPKLPVASARALAQAADRDEDLADAYENRLVA